MNTLFSQSVGIDWVCDIAGDWEDEISKIAIDDSSYLYCLGNFKNNLIVGGEEKVHLNGVGDSDGFIIKLDTSGNVIWANSIGGNLRESFSSASVTKDGSLYLTGSSRSDVLFINDDEIENSSKHNGFDLVICKLSNNGDFEWLKRFANYNQPASINIDSKDNIYISGHFSGKINFGSESEPKILSSKDGEIFCLKISPDGETIWVRNSGDKLVVDARTIDNWGNFYTTGYFTNQVNLTEYSSNYNFESKGYQDAFIMKQDSDGNFQWAVPIGGESYDYGYDVTTDNFGNVYATGKFRGTVDFDPGPDTFNLKAYGHIDAFLVKYDSLGNLIWANQIHGDGKPAIAFDEAGYEVFCDSVGNVYFVGVVEGNLVYKGKAYSDSQSSQWSGDACVLKLDTTGNIIWHRYFGNQNLETVKSIVLDNKQNVYIAGEYGFNLYSGRSDVTDFNSFSGEKILTSDRSGHAYIAKYSPCVEKYSRISVSSCNNYTVPSGNETYFESGTFFDTVFTQNGCDSILEIHLTINNNTDTILYYTRCDSLIFPSRKVHYYSGLFKDTIPNSQGCDSVITIDLIINHSTNSNSSVQSCDYYIAPSGKILTFSGQYYDTIPNTLKCDSIITIDLTINKSSNSSIITAVCDSYISPSGKSFNQSGFIVDTIPNFKGCDSIINIDLSISEKSTSKISVTSCEKYESPSGVVWSMSGVYYDKVSNFAGCDSLMEIHLDINESYKSILDTIICLGDSLLLNNNFYKKDSIYTINLLTSYGCDSIIAINLENSICSDIHESQAKHSFKIFPNPTHGKLNIKLNQIEGNVYCKVFDYTGKLLNIEMFNDTDEMNINIDEDAGVYFVEISTRDEKIGIVKVIKM